MKTELTEELKQGYLEEFGKRYSLLKQVMPPYFFRNVSESELRDILPLLLDIEKKSGIQTLERPDSIVMVYLKDDDACNPIATGRMLASKPVSLAIVHESAPLPGSGRTLVIEQIRKHLPEHEVECAPAVPEQDVAAAYRERFGALPKGFSELFSRINWCENNDLDAGRLAARMELALAVQNRESSLVTIESVPRGLRRITAACCATSCGNDYYARILEILGAAGFRETRTYLREFTRAAQDTVFERKAVRINTFYVSAVRRGADSEKNLKELKRELNELCWGEGPDLFENELMKKHGFSASRLNLLRAAAEFAHSQLSFVDRNAYTPRDIRIFMATCPAILRKMLEFFEFRFDPESHSGRKAEAARRSAEHEIAAVNSGMEEKDARVKMVLGSVLDFFERVLKSNYFSGEKSALSFRLDPGFMNRYAKLSDRYLRAFPPERPVGVFYFWRRGIFGFQIRFSEIARGGWRTVVPKPSPNTLESGDSFLAAQCELFRECFILAHTQHRKNKDIYEGGSKMATLLRLTGAQEFKKELWSAQRAVFESFLPLINYGPEGTLRDKRIVDLTGRREIIEIGPDENMFDDMITWMGNRAAEDGYTLGAGIISGKPDSGINHKHYGVTSFGVTRYLLKTLAFLGIDPHKDSFTLKLSGGPFGDVAGNEIKLLNAKDSKGKYTLPNLKIVAVTDGPAAVFDPDGIDREELSRLVHKFNLDSFDPKKLRGEGAFMIFNSPVVSGDGEFFRMVSVHGGEHRERMIPRDEFMRLFQTNICHAADVFIPCGGRPSTLDAANADLYAPPNGKPSSRAIVEGANSFLTPAARDILQKRGIVIVRDCSANKCGVITSSFEILSGIMLSPEEFRSVREELVPQIMTILGRDADREADWLFSEFKRTGTPMTELSDRLACEINTLNDEISKLLHEKPELASDKLIFEHLPPLFREKFPDRIGRIPQEYRLAVASVELAARIVFRRSSSLESEIRSVM